MEVEHKVFSPWVHISRAEDVPECWVAYCPEFDVMSTGDSPSHALAMVREAVTLAIGADLNEGFDPTARRASSDEDWAPLHALFERHMKLPVSELNNAAQQFTQFAVPFTLTFVRVNHGRMTLGKGPTLSDAFAPLAAA